jgi:hypothetical protein
VEAKVAGEGHGRRAYETDKGVFLQGFLRLGVRLIIFSAWAKEELCHACKEREQHCSQSD